MQNAEVAPDTKICSKQLSPECVKMGSPDLFVPRSRVCKQCKVHINKQFYEANKTKYIEKAKVQSKINYEKDKEKKKAQMKKNYALKKQKLQEQVVDA